MGVRPRFLKELPPMTAETCTIHLLREQGHVTLVMRKANGEDVGVFTMHAVEAKALGKRALELAQGTDGDVSLVEGVNLGGPPRSDQVIGY